MVSTIDCFFFGVCVDYSFHSNCEEQLPSTDIRPTVGQQSADSWPTLNRQVTNRLVTGGEKALLDTIFPFYKTDQSRHMHFYIQNLM